MVLLQFQFTNTEEDDTEMIPDFCDLVINQLFEHINTSINRRKIGLRLNYLLNEVPWVDWDKSRKYNTSVQDIMNTIGDSLVAVPYKDNLWKIQIDTSLVIPNSYTSIERLIRYLNYGDLKSRATGIFTGLEKKFNHKKLNAMWKYFCMVETGGLTDVVIISN